MKLKATIPCPACKHESEIRFRKPSLFRRTHFEFLCKNKDCGSSIEVLLTKPQRADQKSPFDFKCETGVRLYGEAWEMNCRRELEEKRAAQVARLSGHDKKPEGVQ